MDRDYSQFGTVTKMDNGVYKIESKNQYVFYVPENTGGETKLWGYIPGMHGDGQSQSQATKECTALITKQMEGDNPPNVVVGISFDQKDSANILEKGHEIVTASNGTVTSVVAEGFSAGGPTAPKSLNNYLINHPELGPNAAIIASDPSSGVTAQGKNYTALSQNKVPLIIFTNTKPGQLNAKTTIPVLSKEGYNAIAIVAGVNNPRHPDYNSDAIGNGYALYLLGEQDGVTDYVIRTGKDANYKYWKYDPETKKLVQVDSLEDLRIIPPGTQTDEGNPTADADINKWLSGIIEFTEEKSVVAEKYKYLKDDTPYSINYNKYSLNSPIIVSNMNYVASSMNSIKSCVSKTGFIDRLKLSNTGFGGGILGLINSNINGYFNAVGNLLTSISSESKAAVSMAQAWVDQDDALKKGVAGIITDGLLSTNEETPKTPEAPVIHDNQNNQKKYTIKGSTK